MNNVVIASNAICVHLISDLHRTFGTTDVPAIGETQLHSDQLHGVLGFP